MKKTIWNIHDGSLQGGEQHNYYTHDADEAGLVYERLLGLGAAYLQNQVDADEPELGEWELVATNVAADQEHVVACPEGGRGYGSGLPMQLDRLEAQVALGQWQITTVVTGKAEETAVPQGYSSFQSGYSGTHFYRVYQKGRSKKYLIEVDGLGLFWGREMTYQEGTAVLAARREAWAKAAAV